MGKNQHICRNAQIVFKAQKIMEVIELLKKDSRMQLRHLSKAVNIPATTLHNWLYQIQEEYYFTIYKKPEIEANKKASSFTRINDLSMPEKEKTELSPECEKCLSRMPLCCRLGREPKHGPPAGDPCGGNH